MQLLLALLVTSLLAAPSDRYASVAVNADGSVTVTAEDGRQITPLLKLYDPDRQSVGAEKAAVAPDHQSVGWLVLFYASLTSYPKPLKLVIFTAGRLLTISSSGGPIVFWSFQDGGRRVAFYRSPPSNPAGPHYELWDVTRGQRVAEYGPTYENGQSTMREPQPVWVKALDEAEATAR